jgi:putative SOS response-associated peptidase YedK
MCGRFTLRAAPADVAQHFGLDEVPDDLLEARFNIAPSQIIPVHAAQRPRQNSGPPRNGTRNGTGKRSGKRNGLTSAGRVEHSFASGSTSCEAPRAGCSWGLFVVAMDDRW